MTTLRVLHDHAPTPDGEVAWALFDGEGRCLRRGTAVAAELPRANRVEAVVAARHVRIASIALPPMAASRLTNAARFALEDQLAGPPDAQHLAVSPQQADGRLRVTIVDRALLQSIAAGTGSFARPARIVAEPDLAPAATPWRWCASEDGSGFVRCSDGSAFPVDSPSGDGTLPAELALALVQAARSGAASARVQVEAPFDDALLARWQRETGVAFRRGAAWHWHAAPPAAFASALELLPSDDAPAPTASRPGRARLFAKALWIAAAALVLHVVATTGEWAWLKLDASRNAREWTTLAIGAGVAPESAATPSSARAALARRHAELRHSHGQLAPDDALPLLARAAPAMAALPPGTVRNATYVDLHWTLDLARAEAAVVADLDARLRQAGVPALTATTTAGTRVRLGAP